MCSLFVVVENTMVDRAFECGWLIDANGKHVLMMKFRATNGFGGPTIGMARAILDGNSCRVKIDQIEG